MSGLKGISSTTSKKQMNVNRIIEYAGIFHKEREVVELTNDGIFRYTYGQMFERVKKLSSALKEIGVSVGEAVTVFGANTHTTVETLYAVIGLGASAFTANVRIPFEQLTYCQNHVSKHAPNKVAVLEPEYIELVHSLSQASGKRFDHYVILGNREDVTAPIPFDSYYFSEEIIPLQNPNFDWEEIDEDTAAIIMFTTGTTGRPKPVAHSHRMMWLHSVGKCASLGIDAEDNLLILPALYHLGWLLWTEAPFMGAKMVLPGRNASPTDLVNLILDEKVTFTAGVPTLFNMMLEQFKKDGRSLDGLSIYFAGQSVPPKLIEEYDKLGGNARQLFGFTECGPHFVENAPRSNQKFANVQEYAKFKGTVAGYCCCGAMIGIFDEDGNSLPWDGETAGTIGFRALWASTEYWNDPESSSIGKIGDEWLQVGDVGAIDSQGYLKVLDRAKDAIKSGGEWIPSPIVEAAIARFEGVVEVAVISALHPKWIERPIAVIKPTKEHQHTLSEEGLRSFLMTLVKQGELNKYWLPDRVILVDEIPKTSVGKFDKKILREKYKDILIENTANQ
jgi:acyl-CoA synthetase (AMP-forming)/AMP-acid ligase II